MIETITFPVAGMTCASCVNRITRALRKVDGVTRVRVDLARERAIVSRELSTPNATLAAAVVDAGYEADMSMAAIADQPPERGLLARLLGR